MYQEFITVDYKIIKIVEQDFWVGMVNFTAVPQPEKLAPAYQELYPQMAQHFLSSPYAEKQKTATIIIDSSIILSQLSFEQIEHIIKNTSNEAHATQRQFYELFKRPVLQISILPTSINVSELQKLLNELNPEGNTLQYVNSQEEALTLAHDLLKLAHRL